MANKNTRTAKSPNLKGDSFGFSSDPDLCVIAADVALSRAESADARAHGKSTLLLEWAAVAAELVGMQAMGVVARELKKHRVFARQQLETSRPKEARLREYLLRIIEAPAERGSGASIVPEAPRPSQAPTSSQQPTKLKVACAP